jgi:hypothetical protein
VYERHCDMEGDETDEPCNEEQNRDCKQHAGSPSFLSAPSRTLRHIGCESGVKVCFAKYARGQNLRVEQQT